MIKISKVYTGAHGMHYNYLEIVFFFLFVYCFLLLFLGGGWGGGGGEGTTGTLNLCGLTSVPLMAPGKNF